MKKRKKKRHNQKHLSSEYQKKLSFYQNCLKKYPTIAELRFRYALCKYFNFDFEFDWRKKRGFPWKEQRQFHFPKQNKAYIVDFYLPRYKIVFEVDGSSHKGREVYDKKRDRLLSKRKIKVFRIPNEDTVDIDYLVEFIGDRIKGKKKKRVLKDKIKEIKDRPIINLSRAEELRMQEEYIAKQSLKERQGLRVES